MATPAKTRYPVAAMRRAMPAGGDIWPKTPGSKATSYKSFKKNLPMFGSALTGPAKKKTAPTTRRTRMR